MEWKKKKQKLIIFLKIESEWNNLKGKMIAVYLCYKVEPKKVNNSEIKCVKVKTKKECNFE